MSTKRQNGRDGLRCSGDDGAGLVEYALLVTLIVLAALGAIQFFARAATDKFEYACEEIVGAQTGGDCHE